MLRLSHVFTMQLLVLQSRKKLNRPFLSGWQPTHKSLPYLDHKHHTIYGPNKTLSKLSELKKKIESQANTKHPISKLKHITYCDITLFYRKRNKSKLSYFLFDFQSTRKPIISSTSLTCRKMIMIKEARWPSFVPSPFYLSNFIAERDLNNIQQIIIWSPHLLRNIRSQGLEWNPQLLSRKPGLDFISSLWNLAPYFSGCYC